MSCDDSDIILPTIPPSKKAVKVDSRLGSGRETVTFLMKLGYNEPCAREIIKASKNLFLDIKFMEFWHSIHIQYKLISREQAMSQVKDVIETVNASVAKLCELEMRENKAFVYLFIPYNNLRYINLTVDVLDMTARATGRPKAVKRDRLSCPPLRFNDSHGEPCEMFAEEEEFASFLV